MANRSKRLRPQSAVSTQGTPSTPDVSTAPSNTTTTKTNKGASNIMASEVLTQDQIDNLLSKSRPRGEGAVVLEQFIESGAGGWSIDTESGPFKGKSVQQVFTSLTNAKKKVNTDTKSLAIEGADRVRVVKNADGVFLINVGSAAPEA